MEKRVELDIWYLENWSFTLDLKMRGAHRAEHVPEGPQRPTETKGTHEKVGRGRPFLWRPLAEPGKPLYLRSLSGN